MKGRPQELRVRKQLMLSKVLGDLQQVERTMPQVRHGPVVRRSCPFLPGLALLASIFQPLCCATHNKVHQLPGLQLRLLVATVGRVVELVGHNQEMVHMEWRAKVHLDSSKHHIGATKRTLFAKRCILYAAKGLVPKWEDCPAPLGSSPQQLMGVELMPLPQRGRNPPTSPDALPASWVRKESSEDQFDQFAFD